MLLGTAWLCLLSLGGLASIWLRQLLLSNAEPELATLLEQRADAFAQLQARQRDRVALLAARADLRQSLQTLLTARPDVQTSQHALGELLGEAVGTLPSVRQVLLCAPDGRLLAASDPSLLQATPAAVSGLDIGGSGPPEAMVAPATAAGLYTEFQAIGEGRLLHRQALIWAGQPLGWLLVEESTAELQALTKAGPASAHYRVRLQHEPTGTTYGDPPYSGPAVWAARALGDGWRLEVAISEAAVLQPMQLWFGGLLLLAVILTGLVWLVGGVAASAYSRPLALLADYAGQWRVGSPWRARLPRRSSAELQQLAAALGQMALRENVGQKALTEALLETQQVEEQFRRLFENSPVACLLANQRGIIQLINPACASLFGYRVDELHGASIERLMPTAVRAQHSERMQQFFAAPRERLLGVSRDLFGLRRDGVELQIEIGITPIRLGGEALALATINDLSTRKAYEQALLAMSRTDGLTGIPNRRHFDQVLAEEWRRLKRSQQGAAILMIDIDHFKMLNDRHGHLVGDETLRMVAKALKQQLHRPGDFLARYGGEEFVVLLPDTDRDGALLLAEQMRLAVAELPAVQSRNGHETTTAVTISLGVASCQNCQQQDAADLLADADRQLYSAKRAGRNQVMG